MMSINSVISMIVRAPLEFERKSNESKVLARREQAAASGSGLQGDGTVVLLSESPHLSHGRLGAITQSGRWNWRPGRDMRGSMQESWSHFSNGRSSGSWEQFQTVPALGRQERASAILARPRGLRRSWSPSSYASKSYVGRCMRMAQAGW